MTPDRKKKLSALESKKWIPVISELNKIASAIVGLLTTQVQEKEKKIHTLSVMVSEIKIPKKDLKTIEVRLVDMNNTKVIKKGQWSFNKRMNWEKDMKINIEGK